MPSTPHDELVKAVLSIPSQMEAFLRQWMPPFIRNGLVFSTLSRETDSFVDDNLRQQFSDIIYSCNWRGSRGDPLRVSFLLEHKSFVPDNTTHNC
jgi:predicted transposase YdaD